MLCRQDLTGDILWRVQELTAQVRAAKKEAKNAASLILQQELKARRRVLRQLGCVPFLLLKLAFALNIHDARSVCHP